MGRPQPQNLPLGANLLPRSSRQRPEPCLRPALPRPALAQNPLENVADPLSLQRSAPHPQPDQTRLLGPSVQTRLTTSNPMRITQPKKPFAAERTSDPPRLFLSPGPSSLFLASMQLGQTGDTRPRKIVVFLQLRRRVRKFTTREVDNEEALPCLY